MKLSRFLSRSCASLAAACVLSFAAAPAAAQEHIPAKYEIAFNRYNRYAEMVEHLQKIAAAYPEICHLVEIGKSLTGVAYLHAFQRSNAASTSSSEANSPASAWRRPSWM